MDDIKVEKKVHFKKIEKVEKVDKAMLKQSSPAPSVKHKPHLKKKHKPDDTKLSISDSESEDIPKSGSKQDLIKSLMQSNIQKKINNT